MMYEAGFIGTGNMGGALARAVCRKVDAQKVALFDVNEKKAAALAMECGCVVESFETVVKNSRFLFLGVKPQVLPAVLERVRPFLPAESVLVSMAAGVTVAAVKKAVGVKRKVIRIMPNTPAAVGEGMILYAVDELVDAETKAAFCDLLSEAGKLDFLAETLIDAGSAVSGCGPAFAYLFAEALADAGVECGLPRDKAMLYAAQMLKGSAEMLLTTDKHPAALKDAVCSPGGTTIAGVHALEDGGFRGTVMDAVTAAYERTLELAK